MNANTMSFIARCLSVLNIAIKQDIPKGHKAISTTSFYGLKSTILKWMDIQGAVIPVEIQIDEEGQEFIVLQALQYRFHQFYDGHWRKYEGLPVTSFTAGSGDWEHEQTPEVMLRQMSNTLRMVLLQHSYILSNRKLEQADFKFLYRFLYSDIQLEGKTVNKQHRYVLSHDGKSMEIPQKEFRKKWREITNRMYMGNISVN